jgi:hypothetical protein
MQRDSNGPMLGQIAARFKLNVNTCGGTWGSVHMEFSVDPLEYILKHDGPKNRSEMCPEHDSEGSLPQSIPKSQIS